MTYRVVHGGTGLTGREALRGIINDPVLNLVGVIIRSTLHPHRDRRRPHVDLTLELTGGNLPGGDATATRAVNAIAAVCGAPAGVHSALDLVIVPTLKE
jgi:hypothetical protein